MREGAEGKGGDAAVRPAAAVLPLLIPPASTALTPPTIQMRVTQQNFYKNTNVCLTISLSYNMILQTSTVCGLVVLTEFRTYRKAHLVPYTKP